MIYELRVYTVQAGKVGELQAMFEKEALPIITEYYKLVGWWSTDVGTLNQVVHLWAYDDAGHRERARAAQMADPRLAAYRPKALALIVGETSTLLVPASFSPLK
jgi:hypothetical protein